jgi:DNA-binding response OmpR family regulator
MCLKPWKPSLKKNLMSLLLMSGLNSFSGISFLKSIKNRGDTSPVIMMSGYADRSEVQECLNLGAYDFLFKPFHMEVVIEVLQAIDKRNQRFVKMGVII